MPAAPSGPLQNDRRQFSKSEREMPYRRAVDETARGACMLSTTILSFSSSVQRRRRPVSTTPSRSTWVLYLSLSIRTVTKQSNKLDKAAYTGGRPRSGLGLRFAHSNLNRPNPTFALAARSTRFPAPQLNEERLAAEPHRIHRSHGANQFHRPDDIFKIGNKRWLL